MWKEERSRHVMHPVPASGRWQVAEFYSFEHKIDESGGGVREIEIDRSLKEII